MAKAEAGRVRRDPAQLPHQEWPEIRINRNRSLEERKGRRQEAGGRRRSGLDAHFDAESGTTLVHIVQSLAFVLLVPRRLSRRCAAGIQNSTDGLVLHVCWHCRRYLRRVAKRASWWGDLRGDGNYVLWMFLPV